MVSHLEHSTYGQPPLSSQLTAAPGFPGYGSNHAAGRGGRVIKVTTRLDAGTGSLRAALESSGPRCIVFGVGGVFELDKPIVIANGDVSVYCQSAPGGVTVTYKQPHDNDRSPIAIRANNVLIMHLRSRPRPAQAGSNTCCLRALEVGNRLRPLSNICLVNCSFSWGTDENLTFWYSTSMITVACCMIYECLRNSTSADPDDRAKNVIFGNNPGDAYGKGLSFYWNVLAHGRDRSPRLGGMDQFDLYENIIYNQGNWAVDIDDIDNNGVWGNIDGNLMIDGPDTPTTPYGAHIDLKGEVRAHVSDNRVERKSGELETALVKGLYRESTPIPAQRRFSFHDMRLHVLSIAGATIPFRDHNDNRIIKEIYRKTGTHIDCVDGLVITEINKGCRYSVRAVWPADEDSQKLLANTIDCVPETWKRANGLDPDADTTKLDSNGDGYTDFEDYLHQAFDP